jgi:hypothetical protein
MTIPSRSSALSVDLDLVDARIWLEERGVVDVTVSISEDLPRKLGDVVRQFGTCRSTFDRLPVVREALAEHNLGQEPLRTLVDTLPNIDALECAEIRVLGLTTPLADQEALERRMVALLQRLPESRTVQSTAERLQRDLKTVRQQTPMCGGFCVRANQILQGARDPSKADCYDRTGHCASIVAAAETVEISRRSFPTSPAAEAAIVLRGAGCMKLDHRGLRTSRR